MAQKKKPGRPTKMSRERISTVLKCISLGMTRDKAAAYAGIHKDTFYAYQEKFSEFSDQVQQAEAKCQARHLAVIHRASMPKFHDRTRLKYGPADPKTGKREILERVTEHVEKKEANWMASAWILERRWPEEYGRVDRHLIHGKIEGAPLPEQYIAAINRALGVTGKMQPLQLTEGSDNGDGTIDVEILPQG